MLIASFAPSAAPAAAASMTLRCSVTSPSSLGVCLAASTSASSNSVPDATLSGSSGTRILAMSRAPGAAMKLAAMR